MNITMEWKMLFLQIFFELLCIQFCVCGDITNFAFGSKTDIMPAAFGDFNSDELTDLFVISDDMHSVQILLATTKETYFETNEKLQCSHGVLYEVTSVVPGDFDGDALMDVLVTARVNTNPNISEIFIHWGANASLHCTTKQILQTIDEPIAIDFRTDMIIDLFGIDYNSGKRTIWTFNKNRTYNKQLLSPSETLPPLRFPHSHAFLDLNGDNAADLYLTADKEIEIWLWDTVSNSNFKKAKTIPYPRASEEIKHVGQTLFLDLETNDQINQVVPVCFNDNCEKSDIVIYASGEDQAYFLNVSFRDPSKNTWGFVKPNGGRYTDVITLRASDFNNDGYVDILATLEVKTGYEKKTKTFLLENVPCQQQPCKLKRTFEVKWDALSPNNDNAVMGTFFDFMQDGIMDVIFVKLINKKYSISAFKNSLDYDANFIKVMVISGITNTKVEMPVPSLLGTKRFFSSNLPGPKVRYQTTTQDGNRQAGQSSQLPQSAHFALYLPYTIFGLGRTPNFVEDLQVGMFNVTKQLSPIIPNSQLVVIIPDVYTTNPARWRAQLFVTPSKVIWQTVGALAGTCLVIAAIIGVLHWKERREDKIEKLQEAHRFHFDAM